MKNLLILFLILGATFRVVAQDKPAYMLYDGNGKKTKYAKMVKAMKDKDVVMFGESHNSAIAHWLQLELTRELDEYRDLVMGAEMIEADNQDELDLYLKGEIDHKAFDTLARLWPNYDTDYKPLVDYAKDNKIKFIGTNIPRRYANKVYKQGIEVLDSLTAEEKSWMMPLPMPFDIDLPTYQSILTMMGPHGSPDLVKAQATKDATMAHFIMKNFEMGKLFLHYNGSFHSDYYEGIVWYMKLENETLDYGTITTVTQKDITKLEEDHKGKADFIICVDEDVTTTY